MKLLGNLTIWHTVLDWCLFGRVISTIAFRSLSSSNRLSKRTELYWNSSQACFSNHTFTFYAIGLLDKSCMWKRKKLQYKIPATSSLYYINSEYIRSCWKLYKKFKNLLYSWRLKTSLTCSKIKLLFFHWQPNQNFPQIWSFAVNRFEVIKNTFQFSFD